MHRLTNYFAPLHGFERVPTQNEREKAAAQVRRENRDAMKRKLSAISQVDISDEQPIFATCDDVRRMIEMYMAGCGISRNAFSQAIGASDQSLAKFLHKAGEKAGVNNMSYRKSWRFFEQLRIHKGLEKSALRLEDEAKWGADGFYKPTLHHDKNEKSLSKRRRTQDDHATVEPEADASVV